MLNKATIPLTSKAYNPQTIETACYAFWENNHYFAPVNQGSAYCIMLPPPNITGHLHMGHGFGFSLIDILIRYQRMQGKKTLWQGGIDHAGIATQMVVERTLLKRLSQTRQDLGRDLFVKEIWNWKQEFGSCITQQLRRLGASIDWQRERFTLDPAFSYAVQTAFIRLYEEGLIYKGKRLVNWDPTLCTALSDLEVESQEEAGFLWSIRYPLVNQTHHHIIVATTRPETLFGDVAIAVHPEDSRYQHWIGQLVHLPLTNRTIPVIADTSVDQAFGTGCVKITPAHDFNDYILGKRHHLTPINIFTINARLNETVPTPYQGMDRFVARDRILKNLHAQQLLEKTQPHRLSIPRSDRSGTIIEPYLTDQWYIRSKVLAEPAIQAVEMGAIQFIPEHWSKTYFHWMHHIEDWCISRQLWWGHRIPIWYDTEGHAYAGYHADDVKERYQLSPNTILTQEEDVLDTWFSSALWPFVTLGWPKETLDLQTFFPTDVLITGFDILFFWVARMIMFSLKFTQKIPFKTVYVTGLIRDSEGQKMSKSKGNVLDPIDLIDGISLDHLIQKRINGLWISQAATQVEKATRAAFPEGISNFGADALRLTFCSLATHARDIHFDMPRLVGNRYLCNKLWNATRYVLMSTDSVSKPLSIDLIHSTLSIPDCWILSRLHAVILAVQTAITQYRFDQMAQALYEFTWNEFCDWYIELSKQQMTHPSSFTVAHQEQNSLLNTQYTLLIVLEALLRLWHPIIPFITEILWKQVAPRTDALPRPISATLTVPIPESILCCRYPLPEHYAYHSLAEKTIHSVQQIVTAIRIRRSEAKISPAKRLDTLLDRTRLSTTQQSELTQQFDWIAVLAKLRSIRWIEHEEVIKIPAITTVVHHLEIFILITDTLDRQAELERLQKKIKAFQIIIEQGEKKLNNSQFLEKAPKEIRQKQQDQYLQAQAAVGKLAKQLYALQGKA